jgi:oxaloacetate decarboxylase gamma subunit
MMNPISEALLLLVVGMGTVFVVLLLIIFLSGLLVKALNRWAPEAEVPAAVKKAAEIPARTVAAITAAIASATNGKAQIVKIEKK